MFARLLIVTPYKVFRNQLITITIQRVAFAPTSVS